MQTIPAKHIVFKAKSPNAWFGAEYNMNIYRGCSHGCIYCDSRSSCYQNPEFDIVKPKQNALEIVRADLRSKTQRGVVATGAMSDPYNPLEAKLKLTRGALELINTFEYGVAIATKSSLITRDIDVLRKIRTHSPVLVKMTITTANEQLCKKIEPGVCSSAQRFAALKQLAENGIYCGILMMPLLPFINDTRANVSEIVDSASAAGVKFIYPAMGMTLRAGNREYYYEQLERFFPGSKTRYEKFYGDSYSCASPNAKNLWNVFKTQCEKYGILYDMRDIIKQYKGAYKSLSLFD